MGKSIAKNHLCTIMNPITLFRCITMFVGLIVAYEIFLTFSLNDGMFRSILSVSENIVMDLSNVMPTICIILAFSLEKNLGTNFHHHNKSPKRDFTKKSEKEEKGRECIFL